MSGRIRGGWLLMVAVLVGCQVDVDSPRGTRAGFAPAATARGTAIRRAPQLRNAVVGRRNPDGTVTTTCLDDAASVEAFLRDPAPVETRVAQ